METTEHRRDSVNTILSKQQFEEISDCLSKLAEKLQVTAVLLVDSAGRVVAQKVLKSWEVDSTLLSTLTAGSYSAAKEMARILGEQSNFKMILHEGKHHNVYVSAVDGDYFLIVVFESQVALGMVRLFTKRTIAQLLPVVSGRGEGNFKMDQVFNQRFQSLLDDELDRSFKELS